MKKRNILTITLAIVAFLVAAGAAFQVLRLVVIHDEQSPANNTEVAVVEAGELIDKGEHSKAGEIIDTRLARVSQSNLEERAELTVAKARVAEANGDIDDAITTAKDALELGKTYDYSAYLAGLYEEKGDTQKAIEQYEETIAIIRAITVPGGEDVDGKGMKTQPYEYQSIPYYEAKIEALKNA